MKLVFFIAIVLFFVSEFIYENSFLIWVLHFRWVYNNFKSLFSLLYNGLLQQVTLYLYHALQHRASRTRQLTPMLSFPEARMKVEEAITEEWKKIVASELHPLVGITAFYLCCP